MRVLLTGFGGWGGDSINPAQQLIEFFQDKTVQHAEIITKELPIDTNKMSVDLEGILAECTPDIYIGLGSAPGRSVMSIERIGINILDYPIPDNAGNKPIDEVIYTGGPVAYYSTLPIKAILKEWRMNGIPSIVSNTAGTYGCNQTMYTGLHYAATKHPEMRAGFIHVPLLPEQRDSILHDTPSMAFSVQAKAVELAIKAAVDNSQDIKFEGGATC